jgi:hypothetical protein
LTDVDDDDILGSGAGLTGRAALGGAVLEGIYISSCSLRRICLQIFGCLADVLVGFPANRLFIDWVAADWLACLLTFTLAGCLAGWLIGW